MTTSGSRAGDSAGAVRAADLVVIGTGVAGLRGAIAAASAGLRVVVLAKDPPSDSATDKAQGGIAVALSDEDEVGLHVADTLSAGAGLCDEAAVRVMVEEGPRYITELIEWGTKFDREGTRLAFTREGAHSARRVLHAGGDSTGQEILRSLLHKARSLPSISYLTNAYTVDLVVENGRCAGVICLDEATGRLARVAGPVLLAAGGCGRVFRETTNPAQATGDGVSMAYRAGAWVRDMEFVQFHPTSLAVPGAPRFLLSEALRGEGAYLRDGSGDRFMLAADPRRAELAPRDVVSRAIFRRMQETGAAHVYLDMTHMDPAFIGRRFPRIHATCLGYGVDITREPIPVAPSAHYLMGGVATDLSGRSSIPGLYAAGEVSCTGVHGANRLASNSLLEGLVFGARAGAAAVEDAAKEPDRPGHGPDTGAPACDAIAPAQAPAAAESVRALAWERIGIARRAEDLRAALGDLERIGAVSAPGEVTREGVEARNVALVASLVARAALRREESRGAHYRIDAPERDDRRFGVSFAEHRSGETRTHEVQAGSSRGSS